MIKVIVFDFDGVIVPESEQLKHRSWHPIFESYGERYRRPLAEALEKYVGGIGDRFDIMRYVFSALGHAPEDIQQLIGPTAERFDAVVRAGILGYGVGTETREVLERLSKKHPLYLNSATPQTSLIETVRQLGIDQYFKEVLGKPKTKIENFQHVMAQEKVEPLDILFLGDAEKDYEASRAIGCRFIGFANDWNHWKSGEKPFRVITDFKEIEQSGTVV